MDKINLINVLYYCLQTLNFAKEQLPEYTGNGEFAKDDVEDCILLIEEYIEQEGLQGVVAQSGSVGALEASGRRFKSFQFHE